MRSDVDMFGNPVSPAARDRRVAGTAAAAGLTEPPTVPKIDPARFKAVAVIVTVHNQIHVVRPCLRALHDRTPIEATIWIIDDASDAYTRQALLDEAERMNNPVTGRDGRAVVARSEENLRYTKSINRGLQSAFATPSDLRPDWIDWAICLNSDTLVTPGWLERILETADADPRAVLISPYISCVGDGHHDNPMQLRMPPGASYIEASERLASLRNVGIVDAVTPVGACMAVSREIYERLGGFDESVGTLGGGYGEECDYWARATQLGFTARKATNAYVWHQSHASYGKDAHKFENAGFKEFERRHKAWWTDALSKSSQTDPTRRIETSIRTARVKNNRPKVCFYAQALEVCGGILALWNIANGLCERGFDASVGFARDLKNARSRMPHRFGPLMIPDGPPGWITAGGFESGVLVASDWRTGDFVAQVARRRPGIVPMAFVQDREDWFRTPTGDPAWHSPSDYETYLAIAKRNCVVNSRWVMASLKRDYGFKDESMRWIPIGTDPDLFYDRGLRGGAEEQVRILAMSRPTTPRRGHSLMVEMYRRLWNRFGNKIQLATYGQAHRITEFPVLDLGQMPQSVLAVEMAKAHILLEPSLVQGYGMPGQEAMYSGSVLVSTANGGVNDYAVHNETALIAAQHPDGTHDADDLFKLLCLAVEDPALRSRIGTNARKVSERLNWNTVCDAWAEVLLRALHPQEVARAAS